MHGGNVGFLLSVALILLLWWWADRGIRNA
jgi:hypothetical protein